jgi:bifunctional non-homologous end joining protein LigD
MSIAGHHIKISHADKVLFPHSGISKRDLIAYYEDVADVMLPYLKNRPLTLHRFPKGINEQGFYQKNASDYFPDWVQTVRIPKKDGWVNHVICNNRETLVYLVNQGTITFHVALGKVDKLEHPDRLIFDLDPPSGDFRPVIHGAQILRSFLEINMALPSYVMTTGSKGLHVVVSLNRLENFDDVHDFAKKVALYLSSEHPEKFTSAIRKDQRQGRLFLDYLRNSYAQTAVCPFSVRAFEGAPVAMPLSWDELKDGHLNSQTHTIHSVLKRLNRQADPWETFEMQSISINNAKQELEKLMDKRAATQNPKN